MQSLKKRAAVVGGFAGAACIAAGTKAYAIAPVAPPANLPAAVRRSAATTAAAGGRRIGWGASRSGQTARRRTADNKAPQQGATWRHTDWLIAPSAFHPPDDGQVGAF